jgi:hypothetical protein
VSLVAYRYRWPRNLNGKFRKWKFPGIPGNFPRPERSHFQFSRAFLEIWLASAGYMPEQRPRELVQWTDRRGLEHEVPPSVVKALDAPFRAQTLAKTLAIPAQTLANFLTLDSLAQQNLSCGVAAIEGEHPFKGASRDSRPAKISCARPTSKGVETNI